MLRGTKFALVCAAFGILLMASAAAGDATTLLGGQWTKKSYATQGSWKIVEQDGQRKVVLGADFKTKKAPDLKIFLSMTALADLTDKNATSRSLFLGPLESNRGAQELVIPPGTDLGDYVSIMIHCERYSKLWSAATLK